jgi:DNA polymerase III subunit alpha
MSDFVHLHLHTEFSLLDGACRIDELLDQAEQLKMPALAVTEHGNMFSSVVFHDAARKRGINPILGCEVYVAPGDRRDKSGTAGETANHLVLLAENEKGFRNLIKLVSSGYTEGFYYKPRTGRLSPRRPPIATFSAPAISSSRCSIRASTSSASSTTGCCRSRAI